MRGLRKWFPHRLSYVWRQGLANLYRPANQTVSVVLSLGFGSFLLATLLLVQHNLLRSLRVDGSSRRPNLILFDIQPDQARGVDSLLRARALDPTPAVPIVPMRIQSIGGRSVQDYSRDTTEVEGRPAGWALRREYRSTYRDSVVASERLVTGSWWDAGPDSAGAPVSISVEVGLAEELGVSIGDEITWDVQGVPVPSRVTSLREVDWARFETNFFVVFRPGALEAAPQTLVTLVRVDSAAERGLIQRAVVERFANISALDLSTVQRALDDILGKVGAAIRFMAFFTLAAGLVVLLGSLATSRAQRLRETVLLKTLGREPGPGGPRGGGRVPGARDARRAGGAGAGSRQRLGAGPVAVRDEVRAPEWRRCCSWPPASWRSRSASGSGARWTSSGGRRWTLCGTNSPLLTSPPGRQYLTSILNR